VEDTAQAASAASPTKPVEQMSPLEKLNEGARMAEEMNRTAGKTH